MKYLGAIFVLVGVLCMAGCQKAEPPESLTGSGSSFVWPIMTRWVHEYDRADNKKVSYRSRGSSLGIQDLLENKVDFACSDGPLSDERLADLKNKGAEVVHVPLILSAVVPIYNLDEVSESLRFTGPVLADIYLGKVKKWNDPTLRELNPGVKLPDKEINVVHRSDGSGTTYIWTDYLAKVSADWKSKVGTDRTVKFPIGVGADGNEGVAEHVKAMPGSIGYVDLADAYRKSLAFGLVQNHQKEFVKASLHSVAIAANSGVKDIPSDLRYSLADVYEKGAFPIVGTTWAIVYLDQSRNKRARDLVNFLKWVVGDGQLFAEQLLYAKMPADLAHRSLETIERIKVRK
jgi:phosphate transport system substrate-binding protein